MSAADDPAAELSLIAASLRGTLDLEFSTGVDEFFSPTVLQPRRGLGRARDGGGAKMAASAPPRPIQKPIPQKQDIAKKSAWVPPAKSAVKVAVPEKTGSKSASKVLIPMLLEPAPPIESRAGILFEQAKAVDGCTQCRLSQGRNTIVFGVGNPEARIMFIGEGPGQEEDNTGLPFVGPAGQLLTKIIEAMGQRREDVYIANIVKCRPPGNRQPMFDERDSCFPYLQRQIEAVKPEVIVALGATAAHTLLDKTSSIGSLRGSWHAFQGIAVRVTYHPSYLLRQPSDKGKVWEDMKVVMAHLGIPLPGSSAQSGASKA